jgi:hypothetical protein
MKYALLIGTDEQEWAARPEAERQAIVEEYFAVTAELREQGTMLAGVRLQPTSTATTVRVRDELVVTDGPFAETKEQLGGFFLIEAGSDEEARAVAARIPGARYGTIDVRPLVPAPAEAGHE